MSTIIAPSDQEKKIYQAAADSSIKEQILKTRMSLEQNPNLSGKLHVPEGLGDTLWGCQAQVAFASAFVHTWVYTNPCLNFDNGKALKFEGDVWGVGFGAGVVWMIGATTRPPEELVGDVDFHFSIRPGFTELDWWKNGTPVGGIIGGGLSIAVGEFAGSGKFSWC